MPPLFVTHPRQYSEDALYALHAQDAPGLSWLRPLIPALRLRLPKWRRLRRLTP